MNPENPEHLNRLQLAVDWSRRKMEPFRTARLDLLRQYVGNRYGEGGSDKKVIVNLIAMASLIYQRALVPRNPACMISTRHARLKPTAYDMEQWSNNRFEQMHFDDTLRRIVLEALMGGGGFCKVGLAKSHTVQ